MALDITEIKIRDKVTIAGTEITSVETTLTGGNSALPRADAVKAYVDSLLNANDAMQFKGTIGTGGTVTALPTTYSAGWTFRVITAATYAGVVTEVGDLIIAVIDRAGTGNANSDWTVVQTNIDGAVVGPASAISANIARFNGTSGKLIQDSGISFETTLTTGSDAKSPTSKAVATYVTGLGYTTNTGTVTGVTGTAPIVSSGGTAPAISISAATQSAAGSMSSADKTKLDGIATGATANTGTVTSVGITAGTGISVSGSPVTGSGSITVTNSSPDQTVALTGAGTVSVSGTYPNFTITGSGGASGDFLPLTGGTLTGNLNISNTGPVITLKDSDSTGNAQLGYISFQDSTNTEKGWLGFGSSGNTNFTISNEGDNGFINLLGGNVGIGIQSPATKLHVNGGLLLGSSYVTPSGSPWNTTNSQLILGGAHNAEFNNGNAVKLLITGHNNDSPTEMYPILVEDENGLDDFWLKARASASLGATMYLDGNFGIGTTTPNAKLDVDGTANISSNVGIGTTNSAEARLEVRQSSASSSAAIIGSSTVRTWTRLNHSSPSTDIFQAYALELRNFNTTLNNQNSIIFTTTDGGTYNVTSAIGSQTTLRTTNAMNGDLVFSNRKAGTLTEAMRIKSTGDVDIQGNIRLTGTATTTNQARTIEFTGFDKEGTGDFSDNAYIRHTVNSGGLAGSVLEISSQNDADDGINFITNGSNTFRHNGSVIITSNNIGSQSVNFASSAGAVAWGNVSSKPANIMYYQGFTLNANTMDTNATGFTYANNAPATGPVARFSTGGSYDLWLNAPYIGGNELYFRTRNGDNGTLNGWKRVWHEGNISISSGVTANHVVQRDASGYIYANHINFNTSESENPTINSFITSNGDGWSRKSTLAHVKNSIRGVADGTWGINITGDANTVDGQNFSYSNSSNSPTYLWATNSNGSSFLASRGSISVNYANSAGSATSASSAGFATNAGGISASSSASFVFSGNGFGTMNSSNFNPNGSMLKSLGASNAFWLGVWTCTIYRSSESGLSDVYSKKDIRNIVIDGVPIYQPESLKEIEVTEEEENFFEGVKTLFEKLTIYTFNYIGSETNKPDKIGVMAQEIEEVLEGYPLLLSLLIQEVSEEIKDNEGNIIETKVQKYLRTDNLDTLKTIMIKYIYFKVKNLEEAVKQANETIAKIKYVLVNKEVATEEELE
jgi:hypothetical protein